MPGEKGKRRMLASVKVLVGLVAFLVIAVVVNWSPKPAHSEGETAGDFDYYVLALSWSPSWCAEEGRAREAEQCRRPLGFILHGLWPQYEDGWPSYCRTTHPAASRSQTRSMTDIMGSGGSAWHQWKKHGVCSGLSAEAYFELARDAYASVERPAVLRRLDEAVRVPAEIIEEAFLEANPDLTPDMIAITCKNRRIAEARICLTRDLEFRNCTRSVARDCTLDDALLVPIGN